MKSIKYLTQHEAIVMDQLLMGDKYKFPTESLMELAGLSVASIIQKVYPNISKKVLTICGPGNNGGDGLVASRHLVQFGYDVEIFYPKKTDKKLYHDLVCQCKHEDIKFLGELPDNSLLSKEYGLIVDSIFGYSFKGDIRAPFDKIIEQLSKTDVPIASVDMPSGWDVEAGNIKNLFTPALLISLAAPKKGAESFEGIHYLGGRFLPKEFLRETNLTIPKYNGCDQFVNISKNNNNNKN
ncbi:hypothetical protein DICPUDRAFT_149615 [Dictyostelium purpureum]|uniref:NAD(P)H-hydrate epimerase n=1 Tax=Dictyostelium purpureum TaxID=5786 RepID=F0ZE49_DICPU|nr:uncharacterized protein DICPUDRAFT_149615 [Dictyostelium purpureum]EGC37786.1 hypothetical protein DICPUDRAFT_149615 [Dictyostelium purpureum]|eukprot:XP_003285725.1 hypothetical protein DICPUDRAFT_149615 [Dictyostelium purpureum]